MKNIANVIVFQTAIARLNVLSVVVVVDDVVMVALAQWLFMSIPRCWRPGLKGCSSKH